MVKSFQGVRSSDTKKKSQPHISVSEFMTTKLTTFRADDPISKVIDTLTKMRISGAPVVDEDNNLVGIISEVDCLKEIVRGKYNNMPNFPSTVADYMTKDVITLSTDANIFDAATKLAELKIRRFPVLKDGKLVGQISISDVLRAFSQQSSGNW